MIWVTRLLFFHFFVFIGFGIIVPMTLVWAPFIFVIDCVEILSGFHVYAYIQRLFIYFKFM